MSRENKQERFGKAKYKMGFLGRANCPCLYGTDVTDQALRDFLYGSRNKNPNVELPRLKITVDKKELKVTQTVFGVNGCKRKVQLPSVAWRDVLFAGQGSTPDIKNMVACIYYGCDPASMNWPIFVHGYLFESTKMANTFYRHMQQFLNTPEHREMVRRKETELLGAGVPTPRGGTLPGNSWSKVEDSISGGASYDATHGIRRIQPYEEYDDVVQAVDHVQVNLPGRLPRTLLNTDAADFPGFASQVPDVVPRHQPVIQSRQDRGLEHHQEWHHYARSRDDNSDGFTMATNITPVQVPSTSGFDEYSFSYDETDAGNNRRAIRIPRQTSSLTAELKSRLGHGPILLPPRDYDTYSRTRGNISGIEDRRCLNPNIVGSGISE